MKTGEHLVYSPPSGLILVLQYWEGDEARAMRLGRLLADIEPSRRDDVSLCFFRRHDVPESALLHETRMHCGFKFGTMTLQARREGVGHPHGCNELWSSVMEQFADAWRAGILAAHSVFCMEADGVPLCKDWLDVLLEEHERTLAAGKRVTAAEMRRLPHVNGSILAHLSMWLDRPSLHQTPPTQAWDLFHAQVLTTEALPTSFMKNVYCAGNWSDESLAGLAKETAWLASQKDDSALAWAERALPARAVRAPAALGTAPDNHGPSPVQEC